jgi:outer membrane protein OmpA-like peptidoglycan-associated protein
MRRLAAAAAAAILAPSGALPQTKLQFQPLERGDARLAPAPTTRLGPALAPARTRVEVTALARSEVTIAPLQPTTGTAAGTVGSGLQLRATPQPVPSRVEVTALAPSRVLVEALAATQTTAVAALKSELGARETERGTLISLPGDILFDFDEYAIRREARPTLAKLAELIERTPEAQVLVEGHTDAKGSGAYNQALSDRRARAVTRWLVERHGLDAARVEDRGLGESQPAAPNARPDGSDDPEGRQLNRRVEVILLR